MREHDLPSPNIGGKGFHLRRIAAQCISYIEVNVDETGEHVNATDLRAFFSYCADFLQGFDATPANENDGS